jgi:ribosome recycling factor
MATLQLASQKMEKAIEAMRREFGGVRTGKASPALLDSVRVEAYGSHMPLNQVATVTVAEARLLVIQPWDRSLIKAIEKGLQQSELGLNPANDGQVIRVPIPPLTEERRKEFVKILHKYAEEARVAIRQARKDANDDIKKRQKDSGMSEDDARREQDETQKLTDRYIHQVEELLKHKEAEMMEV